MFRRILWKISSFISFPQKILAIILLILLFVLFAGLTCLLVYSIFCYFKDYMWIRKNLIEGRCMQRKELETILKNIHFNRQKYEYVDMLLLQHIESIGEWTGTDRLQYRDDRKHLLF